MLLLILLAGGLVGLLLLNTASAQDSFRLHALQDQDAALQQQEQALTSLADGLDDPSQLAKRAAELGMVAGDPPVFLPRGVPIPKGAIRVGNLIYAPNVVPVTPPPVAASPAPKPTVKAAAKKPVVKKPVVEPVVKKPVAAHQSVQGTRRDCEQGAGGDPSGHHSYDHHADAGEDRHQPRHSPSHKPGRGRPLMSPTAPPPVRQRPVPSRKPARPAARPASTRADRRWGGRRKRPGFRLRSSGRRLRMAAAAMAALFLLLAGRLVQLQGFKSHTYAALAEQQRTHTVDQPATRGEIVDRSGNVLAVDVAAVDVYAQPPKVTDVVGEANKLAALLHMSVADLTADLLNNTPFRLSRVRRRPHRRRPDHQAGAARHRHAPTEQTPLSGRQSRR